MPKVATMYITFITLLLAFIRFHIRYSLTIFQRAIYIADKLRSICLLCVCYIECVCNSA